MLANWVIDLRARLGATADPTECNVRPEALAKLVNLVQTKSVNANAARQVLERLLAEGGDPAEIIEREGLAAMSAGDELTEIITAAIAANTAAADKIKAGNEKAIGPIVGYVMRETKGRADGGEVGRIILEQLRT